MAELLQSLQPLLPSVLLGGISLFIAFRGWRKTDYRELGAKVDGLGVKVEEYDRNLSEKIDANYRELSEKIDGLGRIRVRNVPSVNQHAEKLDAVVGKGLAQPADIVIVEPREVEVAKLQQADAACGKLCR